MSQRPRQALSRSIKVRRRHSRSSVDCDPARRGDRRCADRCPLRKPGEGTDRCRPSRRGSSVSNTRLDRIALCIPEDVEAEDGRGDRERRPGCEQRSLVQRQASGRNLRAPRRTRQRAPTPRMLTPDPARTSNPRLNEICTISGTSELDRMAWLGISNGSSAADAHACRTPRAPVSIPLEPAPITSAVGSAWLTP